MIRLIQFTFTSLCFSLVSFLLEAQEPAEPVVVSIIFEFVYINDLDQRESPVKRDMILRVGQQSSKFSNYSWETAMRDRINNAQQAGPSVSSSGPPRTASAVNIVTVSKQDADDVELFQYIRANSITRTTSIGIQDYLIEETLPDIDWKIEKDTKQLGGYTCQKAIGDYAGRTYIAWFAPQLPFQNGPWKLSGLPGMILEASDTTGEVQFLFKDIKEGDAWENTTTGSYLSRLTNVSERAFTRAKRLYEQDPVSFLNAQTPSSNNEEVIVVYTDRQTGQHLTGEEAIAKIEAFRVDLKSRKKNPIELER